MDPRDRIAILQKKIEERGLAGAALFYSRDILYFTGTAQPSCLVVLPDDYSLFVRSGFEFAVEDVFVSREKIHDERRIDKALKGTFSKGGDSNKPIGTELDILTVEQFQTMRKAIPDFEWVDISPVVLDQRKTKDPSEIEQLREACRVLHRGHEAVLSTLREGVTELELAAAVENAHRLAGHEGIFFIRKPDFFMSRGAIASGENLSKISGVVYSITGVGLSPAVPAGPSRKRILPGEPVIVDIPTLVGGYHADQTRSYCIGKPAGDIKTMYADLMAVADHLIEQIRPGMRCDEIYRMAAEKAETIGRKKHFQNMGRGRISRIIGHGIGLELNEPPVLSEYDYSVITDNQVLAIDLHMMDEKFGAVKIEDMILIRQEGNEILTRSPREFFEV
jgi:Xaa-Pro dipeptidase